MALTEPRLVGCKQGWRAGCRRNERGRFAQGSLDGTGVVPQPPASGRNVCLERCSGRSGACSEILFCWFGDNAAAKISSPKSVRLALGILKRPADQQRLVDSITQLNGGGSGAAQMSHRDGNDISAGSR